MKHSTLNALLAFVFGALVGALVQANRKQPAVPTYQSGYPWTTSSDPLWSDYEVTTADSSGSAECICDQEDYQRFWWCPVHGFRYKDT